MTDQYLATLPIPANFWDRAKQLFTHTEFSYYVRFITAICATAGFIPYEANIIRNIIGCSRTATAEAFVEKLRLFCRCQLFDISQVPENFRVLLCVDSQYDGKILCVCDIFAFAEHLQSKRRKLAIAAGCSHKSRLQEKEKKRSKRKEKEKYNTPHQDTVIKNTGEISNSRLAISDYKQEPITRKKQLQEKGNDKKEAITSKNNSGICFADDFNEVRGAKCEKRFSFRDFRDLWNKWAEHFCVPQFQRLNEKLREKFKRRQEAFKSEGAESAEFWINLLSAVAETSGGFYIGKNDGYRHCGTPWSITAKWLLDSDEHIERFLNAVN